MVYLKTCLEDIATDLLTHVSFFEKPQFIVVSKDVYDYACLTYGIPKGTRPALFNCPLRFSSKIDNGSYRLFYNKDTNYTFTTKSSYKKNNYVYNSLKDDNTYFIVVGKLDEYFFI